MFFQWQHNDYHNFQNYVASHATSTGTATQIRAKKIFLVNKINERINFNLNMEVTIILKTLLNKCKLFHNYCTDTTATTLKGSQPVVAYNILLITARSRLQNLWQQNLKTQHIKNKARHWTRSWAIWTQHPHHWNPWSFLIHLLLIFPVEVSWKISPTKLRT